MLWIGAYRNAGYVFLTAGLWLIVKSENQNNNNFIQTAVGGVLLSFAIVGRQPYLALLIALPFLFDITKSNSRIRLAICLVCSLTIPLYVFSIWQNLVPPQDAAIVFKELADKGITYRVDTFFLCLSYFAIMLFFISPGFFWKPEKKFWLIAMPAFILWSILNHFFKWVSFMMITLLIQTYIPDKNLQQEIGWLLGSILTGFAVYFCISLAVRCHQSGYKNELLFLAAGLLLLAASCIKITNVFSPRYAVQGTPLIILLASYYYRSDSTNYWRIIVGILLGIITLISYFKLSP